MQRMQIECPIYLLSKDCGEVAQYDSVGHLLGHLEAIDVENCEFSAWDARGRSLNLAVDGNGLITVGMAAEQTGRTELQAALTADAAQLGIDLSTVSSSDPASLFELIRGARRSTFSKWMEKLRRRISS